MADKLTEQQKETVRTTKLVISKLGLTYIRSQLKKSITKAAMTNWYKRPVTACHVFDICRAAQKKGLNLKPHHLRPDLYLGIEEFYLQELEKLNSFESLDKIKQPK